MIVWTFQPVEVYEQLKKDGIFHSDPSKSELLDLESLQDAYKWMMTQMEKRIKPKPIGANYPIWAWHTYDWKHKKPDLRLGAFNQYRGDMICIELDIPDNCVLLSDENDWYAILNDTYCSTAMCDDEYEKESAEYEKLSKKEKEIAKRKSWEQIFRIEHIENDGYWRGRYIQATFWEIRMENVREVRFFKGRL